MGFRSNLRMPFVSTLAILSNLTVPGYTRWSSMLLPWLQSVAASHGWKHGSTLLSAHKAEAMQCAR